MSFLSTTPDVIGPSMQIQEEPLAMRGAIGGKARMGYRTRTVHEYRVMWPVDNTGGESVPGTWATDYRLVSSSIERSYSALSGVLTALYRLEGDWTEVWEDYDLLGGE